MHPWPRPVPRPRRARPSVLRGICTVGSSAEECVIYKKAAVKVAPFSAEADPPAAFDPAIDHHNDLRWTPILFSPAACFQVLKQLLFSRPQPLHKLSGLPVLTSRENISTWYIRCIRGRRAAVNGFPGVRHQQRRAHACVQTSARGGQRHGLDGEYCQILP